MTASRLPSSFRDPNGFVFSQGGVVYRQVSASYRPSYDLLMESGLYGALSGDGLLVSHDEIDEHDCAALGLPIEGEPYRVLRPKQIDFIAYPYEWCFGQLKDAALLTLDIQMRALDHGMWLKDASAYNVQFERGRPVFIDTLSFEAYPEGMPWVAYQQFCKHFLGPLALVCHTHVELHKLLRCYIDGIPLDLVSRLLPFRTRLSFSLLTHIHMHASSVLRHQESEADAKPGSNLGPGAGGRGVSPTALRGLVDNLRSAVSNLEWRPRGTEWGDYYDATNYSDSAARAKGALVEAFIERVAPAAVWDLGANTGVYSRIAAKRGIPTVAFDVDPAAVEKSYRASKEQHEESLLPLLMDLTNPSPDLGWAHAERMSLTRRGPVDLALALALVHHLAISNNVPLDMVASFLRPVCRALLIEFVPKSDSQVQRLLASREDIFPDYTQEGFEAAFLRYFELREREPIEDSGRVIYLLA